MNRNSKHGKISEMVWWFFLLNCVVSGFDPLHGNVDIKFMELQMINSTMNI